MTIIDLIGLGMGLALVLQIVGLIVFWQIFRREDDDHWDI
jgi:hypothetical protein